MRKYSGNLYCFSPPVMLATFLFEFGSAFYMAWRYKMTTLSRLIVALLLALGTFQLAEYMVCGGLNLNAAQWARFGYISITLLPPLGIHLVATIAGKKVPRLISTAYGSALLFGLFFAFTPGAINAAACRPNYAVFHLGHLSTLVFAAYYYGWLVAGTTLSIIWARKQSHIRAHLYWMSVGYLSFMVPTTTANLVDPSTIAGIPSVMCGFAVILAIILVARIAPLSAVKSVEHASSQQKPSSI